MEEKNLYEEYTFKLEEIRKEREQYQECLIKTRKEEKEFEITFFNNMLELEVFKADYPNEPQLLEKTENCQNRLKGIKRRVEDILEKTQKEMAGKIKSLDDKEGQVKYEISQMKK